nr:YeeE/YedE thiosulfate transporter family protein [uncultured Roseobacter sp.]
MVDRCSARFRAFGVTNAGAGAVSVPLLWLFPTEMALSAGYPFTVSVVFAGAAVGFGARLNNACVLGTLAHLTGGNLTFGYSELGMIIGATAMTSGKAVASSWSLLHLKSHTH